MSRIFKRFVVKYFGGTKNFVLWTVGVILTIYILDSYIFTDDRLRASSSRIKDGVVNMDQIVASSKDDGGGDAHKDKAGKPADSSDSKQEPPKPPPKIEPKCGLASACPAGQFAYYIKTGEGGETGKPPTICWEDNYAIVPSKANGHRGINVAVIDDKTHKVVDSRYYDTYVEDGSFVRYMKLGIRDNHIILAASWDEMSTNLKDDGRAWLKKYGAGSKLNEVKFRDAYALVGQRGLAEGKGMEKHSPREGKAFADSIELSGCISIPLGSVTPIEVKRAEIEEGKAVKLGEEMPNCGVKENCGPDSFPVHLFTGKSNSIGPKICVSGKYVMANGLNDGGRGLNIVIVDPVTKDVARVGHFDTYAEDSSNLEIFLEMMNEKEIILAVAHDDASKNLNLHSQLLLQHLGSSMIDKLTFRDVWVFAGQQGIDGHSTLEELQSHQGRSHYTSPLDVRACVHWNLKGSQIKPDPLANKNEKRRAFCAKYDGYGDFCVAENIDEQLTPAPLTDKSLENHAIFHVPVIVIPGMSHNAVRMQLETLLMQPGLMPDMVTVMYDEKFDESAALAELFRYKTAKLSSSTKYAYQVEKALSKVWELYPSAKHVIVLEEEVILAPDFLSFLAQCLETVENDDTLIGITAWNENGYQGLSTNPSLAYRTETFPGLGLLLKRSFYKEHMLDKMHECCVNRSWDGWFSGKLGKYEMIVPDVSRVYRRPYEGLSGQADFLTELFNRQRVTNLETKAKITNIAELSASEYEASLNSLISAATPLDTVNVGDCLQGKGLGFYIPKATDQTYTIYFEQSKSRDLALLSKLVKCFELFHAEGYNCRGLHKDTIRFTTQSNTILMLGSASPYYHHKPDSYTPVKNTATS